MTTGDSNDVSAVITCFQLLVSMLVLVAIQCARKGSDRSGTRRGAPGSQKVATPVEHGSRVRVEVEPQQRSDDPPPAPKEKTEESHPASNGSQQLVETPQEQHFWKGLSDVEKAKGKSQPPKADDANLIQNDTGEIYQMLRPGNLRLSIENQEAQKREARKSPAKPRGADGKPAKRESVKEYMARIRKAEKKPPIASPMTPNGSRKPQEQQLTESTDLASWKPEELKNPLGTIKKPQKTGVGVQRPLIDSPIQPAAKWSGRPVERDGQSRESTNEIDLSRGALDDVYQELRKVQDKSKEK